MRRFDARRLTSFIILVSVVVLVQISFNVLLTYCGKNNRFAREDSRGITTGQASLADEEYGNIIGRLRAAEQSLQSFEQNCSKLKLKEETKGNITEILKKKNGELSSQLANYAKLEKIISAQEFSKVKTESSNSDFLKGDTVENELRVVPFDSFTRTSIYTVNKEGLLGRPALTPQGTRYIEHNEVLRFSLRVLNDEFSGHEKLTDADLDTGITRLSRLNGMQYNLFFSGAKPKQYHRVKIRRPFSNLELVDSVESVDTSEEPINLIIPLSERTKQFQAFLERFADACVRWDSKVSLTVVYFGQKGRERVQEMLHDFEKKEKFKDYKLIFEDGPFSRGVGLQKGVLSWDKGNNIMFFCDVDVYFTPHFLERCRLYSEPGKMVYYPIVYSLYNPDVVYNGAPPSIEKQFYVGKNNGFWRDFGFGMTCVYRNDFISTRGFDTTIQGWGTEDLKLYRKFLRTDLAVIRATDRGIFHLYHPKNCDPILPDVQYMSCLKSKALTEGSHRQMGMLAFGTKLFSNLQPDWKTKLLYKPDFSTRSSKVKSEQSRNLLKKADELEIETLEIKLLKKRLEVAMNFTVHGEDIFKFNTDVLNDLLFTVQKRAEMVKELAAKEVDKDNETQDNDMKPTFDKVK